MFGCMNVGRSISLSLFFFFRRRSFFILLRIRNPMSAMVAYSWGIQSNATGMHDYKAARRHITFQLRRPDKTESTRLLEGIEPVSSEN